MLDHVASVVSDIDRSIKWYAEKFDNFKVLYQDETLGMIDIDGAKIAFVLADMHPPHIAIEQKSDVPEDARMHRDGSYYIYDEDPDGNVIERIWWV